jgi:hypothetical protein
MSVEFGRWNFEGPPPTRDYIEKVRATLAPYGPDSNESYSNGGIQVLYDAFHTTKESRREKQLNSDRQLAALQNVAMMFSTIREKKTLLYFASGIRLSGLDGTQKTTH